LPFLAIADEIILEENQEALERLEEKLKEKDKEINAKMEKMEKELKKQQFLSAQLKSLLEQERFNQLDEEVKKEILKGDVKFVKKDEIKAKKS